MKRFAAAALICFATAASAQEKKVTVVKAGPIGELATLAEANEIRVVFSAPMVAVGKIPKNLTIPWFHISPDVKGTFRWSGTTTLIFTPSQQLPYATKYDVSVDAPHPVVMDDDHVTRRSSTARTSSRSSRRPFNCSRPTGIAKAARPARRS